MSEPRPGVSVRSYREVVDAVERRIFRIDRWRLPTPHGVSVRAIGYALACLAAIAIAASLPLLGPLVELVPESVRYLALPALGGWGLSAARIDGRPPHHALLAAVRHRLRPRTLSGLRPTAAVGARLAPVAAVQIASTGDEPAYRRGRVRGPARIVLRYPAELRPERGRRPRAGEVDPLAGARRVRVRGLSGRALSRGEELRVPAGAEVVFE